MRCTGCPQSHGPHARAEGEGRPEQMEEGCQDLFRELGSSVVFKEEKVWKMEEIENLRWGLQCCLPLHKEHSRHRAEP